MNEPMTPKSILKSPRNTEKEAYSGQVGHDKLAILLDEALKSQERYVKMFPHMKYLINDQNTKSLEDMTLTISQQAQFLFSECK